MRRTEDGLIPTVLAIAGALQWVASWGGAWLVSATTRSTVSVGSGGMREGRVLSRVNPSIPSCIKRSCQRQTTVLPLPTARVMAVVPAPSAVRTMIRARQTCCCALLRLRMIVSSRTRSSAVTVMEIPLRITDNRTKPNLQKLLFRLFCQVLSTRICARVVALCRQQRRVNHEDCCHRRHRAPAPQGKSKPDEKVARVRFGSYEFKKKGVSRFDLRDPYHLAVALTWPQFLAVLLALYLSVNVVFATLFWLVPGSVANTRQDSFADAFFFSIET